MFIAVGHSSSDSIFDVIPIRIMVTLVSGFKKPQHHIDDSSELLETFTFKPANLTGSMIARFKNILAIARTVCVGNPARQLNNGQDHQTMYQTEALC